MDSLTPPTAAPRPASPNYGRWRALTLVIVHLLFAAHIVHWRLAGKTLAPLELNELMYTLEVGIITAGFLFMVLVIASVLVFGRFFCSWGCHILALQDGCSWLMEKAGVKPKMVRTRALLWVPIGAMLYMFAWPQIQFFFLGRPRPALHVTDDSSGWASFVTEDFWRNLPAPGIALLTFAVCGFAFVYFMGHRAFCRYACPYGAIFAWFDKLSPGKIARVGDCSACGLCSAACQSDIRVHEELDTYGQVVNSACMKDLDCLSVCPDGAIGFRFQKPSLFRKRSLEPVAAKQPMFSMPEDVLMAAAFVPLVLIFRGLYGMLPFLLSLALAGMTVYAAILLARLLFKDSVSFVRTRLKTQGTWRSAGMLFAIFTSSWLLFVAHSATIRIATWTGASIAETAGSETRLTVLDKGLGAFRFVEEHGFMTTPGVSAGMAELEGRRGELLADAGRLLAASSAFERAVRREPDSGKLRYHYARLLSELGRLPEALPHYRIAAQLMPTDPETANNLGYVLMELGQAVEARAEFERAVALDDALSHAHFNLGRLRFEVGDTSAALIHFRRAAELEPQYAQWLAAQADLE